MEKYTYIGIATGLVILVIISGISHHSLVQVKEDFDWAVHTREVMLDRFHFLSNLRNAETGQLSFLLTGQEQYLEPYQYLAEDMEYYLSNLRVAAAGSDIQRNRIHLLKKLVNEKLTELEKLITLQKDKGRQAAKGNIAAGDGKRIANDIQTLVLEMDKEEKWLLDERARKIDTRIKLDAVVKGVGVLLILAIAVLVTIRVRYWLAERRKAEKQQMEVINAKSDFISMVSHELRTPLTVIKEGIALVVEGLAGDINEEQKELLDISRANVDRLARLINDVLDFQKIKSGKMTFNLKANDINETVNEVYEAMSSSVKNKGIDFLLECDGNLPETRFDSDKITQVLTNLVGNAMKFTEKGNVTIKTGKRNGKIEVSVSDTGCGIKQKDLPRLFNRFEQLATGGERKTGGTGLGLAITAEIVEQHDGDIRVESEFGKGSKFTFTLHVYSTEELFTEYINDGIKQASKNDTKMSLLVVSIADFDEFKQKFSDKKINSTLKEMEDVLANGLRIRSNSPDQISDTLFKPSEEVYAVLINCGKERILEVKERLKQKLDDYLIDRSLADKIELLFGCATYPDDAITSEKLAKKASQSQPLPAVLSSV